MSHDPNILQNARSTIVSPSQGGSHSLDELMSATLSRSTFGKEQPEDLDTSPSNVAAADIIGQVERRITAVQDKLASGSVPAYMRHGLEMQLQHLRNAELPYARARAGEVQARQDAARTSLADQHARAARIEAGAIRRAEEIEIEERARLLLRR